MAMAMQPQSYDKKAWLYAKHRWDYPKPAIDQVLATTGIGEDSVVADIGSGTGSLARHFLPVAKRVYGVEPVFEMRKIADDQLAPNPNFKGVRGSAEETTLPDASVDLIDPAGRTTDTARADSEGRFALTGTARAAGATAFTRIVGPSSTASSSVRWMSIALEAP